MQRITLPGGGTNRFFSVFILDYEYDLPPVMISFAKLLLLPTTEWEKTREKSKPPKPKFEGVLYDILISTLESRLAEYPTTLEVVTDFIRLISLELKEPFIGGQGAVGSGSLSQQATRAHRTDWRKRDFARKLEETEKP